MNSCIPRFAVLLSSLMLTLVTLTAMGETDEENLAYPSFLPQGRNAAFLGVVSQPTEDGIYISDVVEDSAAWNLGLEEGDVIEAIDGFRVGIFNGTTYSLPSEIRRSGSEVILRIRDGETGEVYERKADVGGRATNKGSKNRTPRLGVTSSVDENGETVQSVNEGSAADKAGVRVGDVILTIDGYRVGVIQGNVYSLASEIRHASDKCSLRIFRDGKQISLLASLGGGGVNPNPNPDVNPDPNPNPNPNVTGRVHALLIGLTDDESIGAGCRSNLSDVGVLLENIPEANRGSLTLLEGENCRAEQIMNAAREMNVQPGDTVFCYYCGHGAYNPNEMDSNDSSGGHFFQIPGGDLMRKSLMAELRGHGAKLTVLITDTCNVPGEPHDIPPTVGAMPLVEPPFVTLLLRYSGVVDISGSTRGQYGWYLKTGGIFTIGLTKSIVNGSTTWSGLLEATTLQTTVMFEQLKGLAQQSAEGWDKSTRESLLAQEAQLPQAFTLDVTLD